MNLILFALILAHDSGVREITATPCDVVKVNVALGMSTVLDLSDVGEPTLTLVADETHYHIKTHENARRSIAILPAIQSDEIQRLTSSSGNSNPSAVALLLDQTFQTNLFVYFKSNTRMIFQLRWVEKPKVDYVVKVRQTFRRECRG